MKTAPQSIALVREFLDYCPSTGILTWKVRDAKHFPTELACKRWNILYAGKTAFPRTNPGGYSRGSLLGRPMLAHRAAWAIVYGYWPPAIDHINGIRTDNRLSNLRSVTALENQKNQRRGTRNKSGVVGVCWAKREGKWRATIYTDGKDRYIGLYDDFGAAVAARKEREARLGFHPNHGN